MSKNIQFYYEKCKKKLFYDKGFLSKYCDVKNAINTCLDTNMLCKRHILLTTANKLWSKGCWKTHLLLYANFGLIFHKKSRYFSNDTASATTNHTSILAGYCLFPDHLIFPKLYGCIEFLYFCLMIIDFVIVYLAFIKKKCSVV